MQPDPPPGDLPQELALNCKSSRPLETSSSLRHRTQRSKCQGANSWCGGGRGPLLQAHVSWDKGCFSRVLGDAPALMGTGVITTGTVISDFFVNGPDGARVPDTYGQGTLFRDTPQGCREGRVRSSDELGGGHESMELQVPAAVDESRTLPDTV